MARFRAKYRGMGYRGMGIYIIQKHNWLLGWIDYDNKNYYVQEAKQRLMDIKASYPNVCPVDDDVLGEIEVKRDGRV